jgi:hypothetical protein
MWVGYREIDNPAAQPLVLEEGEDGDKVRVSYLDDNASGEGLVPGVQALVRRLKPLSPVALILS